MGSSDSSCSDVSRLYPPPGTRRAYIHQPCDEWIVAARPDLKFQLYRATAPGPRTGFGFVLLVGGRPVSFDFEHVQQRFDDGSLPILSQQVSQNGFWFHLESLTTRDPQGRGVVRLRLTVWRQEAQSEEVDVGFLAVRAASGAFSSHPNEDYIPLEVWGEAWEKGLSLSFDGCCVHDGAFVFAGCRGSPGVILSATNRPDGVAWMARVKAGRDAPETLEVFIPYDFPTPATAMEDRGPVRVADDAFSYSERETMMAVSFDSERDRQRACWLRRLGRGTRICLPDTRVQDIYRTLTLNNLQFLGGSSETTHCRPGQGGYNHFGTVYAWEASHFLIPMARQGYHAEVRRVLDYLLTTQSGHPGPEGEVSDADGSFRPHIHWMNETGAVLRIFSEYALASGDLERLRADAAALLRAARWIQRQRRLTRERRSDGPRALHDGLLPKGRPHDWPIRGYFLFSDTYTWSGLDALARAFAAANLPDSEWLRREADDYRECILAAVRGSMKPHPVDSALAWVPSDIYEDPAEAIRTTIFCGPHSLLGSGILDPNDELVTRIEKCLRAAGCLNGQFAFRMRSMEDEILRARQMELAGGHVDLYYVTFAEAMWHRVWMECGEWEKARGFFNMTLNYALSRDLHLAHERFCPQLPWLLPWQPNASANGRVLSMIIGCLCYTKGDICHLLQGVPDEWFAARVPLGLDDVWIDGGTLSFRLEPQEGNCGWAFRYGYRGANVPRCFRLAMPGADGCRVQRDVLTGGIAESVRAFEV